MSPGSGIRGTEFMCVRPCGGEHPYQLEEFLKAWHRVDLIKGDQKEITALP